MKYINVNKDNRINIVNNDSDNRTAPTSKVDKHDGDMLQRFLGASRQTSGAKK